MKKVIVITSGKGGVGKTTTAINLAAAMSYFGKDVLVVDANLSTPNVGIHLGSPEAPIHLNHVLADESDVYEAVYQHDSGMKILPSSISMKEMEKINYDKLKDFKSDFKKISEFVIVDSSAGLGSEAKSAIELADELIVITNPEIPAITDALKALKVAEKLNKPVRGIIVTRVRGDNIEMTPEIVKEMLEVPVLGMIPEDINIKKSLNERNPVVYVYPKSKASRAYKEIAAKILELEYDSNKDRETLLQRIRAIMKERRKRRKY